jgi:hypothetical protein
VISAPTPSDPDHNRWGEDRFTEPLR